MNLSATEIHLIREALTIAENHLRYAGTTFGPEYHRSMAMADLHDKVGKALENLTLPVEITA